MFNRVGLLGRLAQEPEIRYTTGGTPVARFDLAVPVPSKKKDTPPDYIPVVCWDKWADFCGKYLTKGRQVVVEGRITTRKWQDNDGKQLRGRRYKWQRTADRRRRRLHVDPGRRGRRAPV